MKIKFLTFLFTIVLFTSCATTLPSSFNSKTLEESNFNSIYLNLDSKEIRTNRQISFKNITNFRDIGGIETEDDKFVKWGLIFRSDNLSSLKKNEFRKFNSLNIKTVIDLRTKAEIALKEDILPDSTAYFSIPIVSDQGDLMAQMKGKVIRGEITEAQSKELMQEFYTKCVTENIPLLRKLIFEITTSKNPILYHCSAGKDRTGIVTAILLSILKVDRQTIIDEYLLSNYYRGPKIKSTLKKAKILKIIHPNLNTQVILNFMAVDSEYINAVFDIIDSKYGGMDSFIANQLDIDEVKRNQFINKLTY